jgi:hypothetical protein
MLKMRTRLEMLYLWSNKTTMSQSKWPKFFFENPREEGEGTMSYLRRVLKRAQKISEVKDEYALKTKYNKFGKVEYVEEVQDYKKAARILVFDIETAPLKAWVWGKWKQNISDSQVIEDWFMLCWSAKWLFEDSTFSAVLTPEEAVNQDDRRITELLWEKINEASCVIAHNAHRFDVKRVNTRFLIHGMPPPMPYKVIDTLLHLRNQFANSSNRLDSINEKLGLRRKIDTGGFDLWAKCCAGDAEALRQMEVYNIGDVKALEEHYLRIRPWIQPHPNIGLHILDGVERCPSCGSSKLQWQSDYHTTVNIYSAFRCGDCGSTGRSRKSAIPVAKRAAILSSLPKSK